MNSNYSNKIRTDSDTGWFMIVDDEESVRKTLQKMLSLNPKWHTHACASSSEAFMELESCPGKYDVILTDLAMPGQNGFQLLDALERLDSSLIRIIITGNIASDNLIKGIRHRVFDIIPKPVNMETLHLMAARALAERKTLCGEREHKIELEETCKSQLVKLRKTVSELRQMQRLIIEKFAAMAEMRENKTGAHGKRVAKMFSIIAKKAGLSQDEIEKTSYGALLHDIGKIAVPDRVLLKRGALNKTERKIINSHVNYGSELLQDIPFLSEAVDIVRCHHEQYDGNGYPKGLKGGEIPLASRIFAVIDAYDVMRNNRPYRRMLSESEAVDELRRCAGSQFDPVIVDLFMQCRSEIEEIIVSNCRDHDPFDGNTKKR